MTLTFLSGIEPLFECESLFEGFTCLFGRPSFLEGCGAYTHNNKKTAAETNQKNAEPI